MRIDKFLWCTRYYKTRTQATEACKKGRVLLNDENTKPSKEVFAGDIIKTRINQIERKLEILAIPESRMGAKRRANEIENYRGNSRLEWQGSYVCLFL